MFGMFGIGPIELLIVVIMLAAMAFVGWLVLRVLIRAAYHPPLKKCPHCGKDLP